MNFKIRNSATGKVYAQVKTLSEARGFCRQRLLRVSGNRTKTLSDIAAGIVNVYEARNTRHNEIVFHPGF